MTDASKVDGNVSRVRAGRVLDLDPELGAQLPREDWESAREACRANLVEVPEGPWRLPWAATADRPNMFALLLTDGLLIRETALAQHRCLELLCPGDVLLPPPHSDGSLLVTTSNFTALGRLTLMVLSRAFLHAAARWPPLLTAVQQRLADQQARLATQGLVLQLPRAEHRILVTLWLLAERCGRVTRDGLLLPLTFTHEALSRITGARRPTVSLALAHLQTTGCVSLRGERLILTAAAQTEVLAVTAHQDDLAIGASIRTDGLPTPL